MKSLEQIPLRGILQAVKPMEDVDISLLAICEDMEDAILLCVTLSRRQYGQIAHDLDMKPSHFTKCLGKQYREHFPPNKIPALQRVCGNWAVRSWQNLDAEGGAMEELKAIREERERLEEIEQRIVEGLK